jgi:hypothetical protein
MQGMISLRSNLHLNIAHKKYIKEQLLLIRKVFEQLMLQDTVLKYTDMLRELCTPGERRGNFNLNAWVFYFINLECQAIRKSRS